jgi:hypothetical protein
VCAAGPLREQHDDHQAADRGRDPTRREAWWRLGAGPRHPLRCDQPDAEPEHDAERDQRHLAQHADRAQRLRRPHEQGEPDDQLGEPSRGAGPRSEHPPPDPDGGEAERDRDRAKLGDAGKVRPEP